MRTQGTGTKTIGITDEVYDRLVAGVARSLSVPVVTRNGNRFQTLDGVRVEAY